MRYALIIVFGACYYLGWLPASFVVPALLVVSALRLPTAGPTPRRGGYIHQPSNASVGASQETAQRVAMYTGSFNRPGNQSEAEIPSMQLADLSKIIARGSSTLLTGFNPGHPTTAADCGCEDAA